MLGALPSCPRYANLAGRATCEELGALTFCGRSAIVAPDGTDLARAPHCNEDGESSGGSGGGVLPAGLGDESVDGKGLLLVATLDRKQYEGFTSRNPYLEARRPELYGNILDTPHTTDH